jgi:hypothetical protein
MLLRGMQIQCKLGDTDHADNMCRSHIHDEALIDITDKGRLWNPIPLAYLYKYDPLSDILSPAGSESNPVDWFHFIGHWGDEQLPDSDEHQKTVPHFGLKKYVGGPTGPKFKHLDRSGISPVRVPDQQLLRMAVRTYIYVYNLVHNPVAWIVLVLIIVAVAAARWLPLSQVKSVFESVLRAFGERKGQREAQYIPLQSMDLEADGDRD